ncbi:MAG: glycosyltransferase family 2 protein, partial [Chitinophagaceae bacterium]|nr:glycosyltransferase family 2 protein [Chitinophagaceae bacterium]
MSVQSHTDDIVVLDTGSTDGTIEIVSNYNVRLRHSSWEGFGMTKQKATALAKYNWVLSIDGDEIVDEVLQHELSNLHLKHPTIVYKVRMKNFLGTRQLKWGQWGFDKRIKLFNRKVANWNNDLVHEKLTLADYVQVKELNGSILHYTFKDVADMKSKLRHYAKLTAEKYFQQGKKAGIKRFLSPAFMFLRNYIFLLGFLDGADGLHCARATAFYTFLKYHYLHKLWYLTEQTA